MDELQTTTICSRHPKVKTNLRCASCGAPICPDCMVHTPVGAKCRDCGSQRGGKLFTFTPVQAAAAFGVALAMGAVAGWAVSFEFGFLTLFIAFAYGGFAGQTVLRVSGRKRGGKMEAIAGVAMALGALGGRMIVAAMLQERGMILDAMLSLACPSPIPILALVVAIASAITRIRYI